jgi:hypothetical protein
MSALPPKADMCSAQADVCFVPKADIQPFIQSRRQRWFAVAGRLTLGVGRPIAPMSRTQVNACLDSHHPAAKNTATGDGNCMYTV